MFVQTAYRQGHVSNGDGPLSVRQRKENDMGRQDRDVAVRHQDAYTKNKQESRFFNSIQALQHRQVVTDIDELIEAVQCAFDELDFRVLDKTFMTLQKIMEESLTMDVDNLYKLPQ
ncbi:hypothetical protein H310_14697 [Aphanomyces invadans]|uniref:Uncharacterized protein n=1 Tax=Aphanomyces invadans TaxID=157072 RepID=A0A024TB05_9STRA|nr:hypothetical protein H310_14697 [Aphanomyces invadans]ETV90507.1 hypothetical protein H310_14697 [Aphanomyces invadans]|eukprot:XP_008880823.1 hypothetical protein H310_14697 [Aphanomyces invadans]